MGDAGLWTIKSDTKKNTIAELQKFSLPTDETGQYQHNDAAKYVQCLQNFAKEMINPLDKKEGIYKLFAANPNDINGIKTRDTYNWKYILKKYTKEAAEATKADKPSAAHLPLISDRNGVQDKANRLNQANQAVLGVKEGFKEVICKQVEWMHSHPSCKRPMGKRRV